jgi:anti-sigma factor RsiW
MISHSNCRFLLSSLSEYVDGDLSDDLCLEIKRHVADCEDCQIVINTLQKTIDLYHKIAEPPEDIPSDVRERLFIRLDLDEFLKR